MKKDLFTEQKEILNFELTLVKAAKRLKRNGALSATAIAASLAPLAAAAHSASDKLGSNAPVEFYQAVENNLLAAPEISAEALMNIASIVSAGHDQFASLASGAGVAFLQVGGGTPKPPAARVVGSILGL